MIKWIKIAGTQYLGFWIFGLILLALQEVPYMELPLFELENDPIMNMRESSIILDMIEKALGSLCAVTKLRSRGILMPALQQLTGF